MADKKKTNNDVCEQFGKDWNPQTYAACKRCEKKYPEDFKQCKELTLEKKGGTEVADKKTDKKAVKGTGAKKTVVKKAAGAGANKWGHKIGSQADKIDQAILGKGITDVEKAAKAAGVSTSRVKGHMAHLQSKGLLKKK